MPTETKTYSIEQVEKLTQFHRAEGHIRTIFRRWNELTDGVNIMLFDKGSGGKSIDIYEARVMVGALNGLFNEAYDLGLRGELQNGES
jgi:hypothetical protein